MLKVFCLGSNMKHNKFHLGYVIFITLICIIAYYCFVISKSEDFHNDEQPESGKTNMLINFLKKKVIKSCSGKSYNLNNPEIEDFSQFHQGEVLEKIFEKKKNGTFIEVGAFDGESISNTLILERKHGWTGLLIEPIPSAFKKRMSKNRKVQAAHCCLSHEAEPTNVSFRLNAMLSHIISPNETNLTKERLKYLKKGGLKKMLNIKDIKVDCYPLYHLMAAANLTSVDLLSLDLEGSEVKVLKTLPWDKVDIKAIIVEINHIPEGKDFLEGYLTALNYTLVNKLLIDYLFVKQ